MLLLSPPGSRPLVAQDEVHHAEVDRLLSEVVATRAPGVAVIIQRGDRVLHRSGAGVADLARGTAFTVETPTYIASIGKVFTAMAVLRLVDRGVLALDARLGDLLPDAPRYAHAVTIRQLLSHTSGLPDHYDLAGEDRSYTRDDVLEVLRAAGALRFAPGRGNAYSNSAYVLLADVVARHSGLSFGAFLAREFFEPFGMQSTTVVTRAGDLPAGRAVGYRHTDGAWERYDYESSTVGAGGIYASAADLARFAEAVRDGRVLSRPMLDLAMTMVVRADGRPTPYGMGWLSETGPLAGESAVPYVAAVGSLRGFWALWQWWPGPDLTVIWVANDGSNGTWDALLPLGTLAMEAP